MMLLYEYSIFDSLLTICFLFEIEPIVTFLGYNLSFLQGNEVY